VWRRRDQSGKSRAAAERSAAAEGVRDRVELADADARDLPFASGSFNLVVSSLALSNIREAGGRAQALREAVQVLGPGPPAAHRRSRRGPPRRYAAGRRLRRRGCPAAGLADLVRHTGSSLAPGRSPPGHPAEARQPGPRATQSSAMAANAAQKMCAMTRVQGATSRSGSSDAVPALSRPAGPAIVGERCVVSRTTTSVLAVRRRVRRCRFMAGVAFCGVAGAISGGAAFSRPDASRGLCPCRR
jgi:Methyltransferase domain